MASPDRDRRLSDWRLRHLWRHSRSDQLDLTPTDRNGIRGYFEANGRFQLDPYWTVKGSLRAATTRPSPAATTSPATIGCAISSAPSGLTSTAMSRSKGGRFQGLRSTDKQERIPIALPALDARLRLDDPVLGGQVELQANSLAILRIEGQDTQRLCQRARWDLRRITRMGQELTLTAFARADAYQPRRGRDYGRHLSGKNGWQFRGSARWRRISNGRWSAPVGRHAAPDPRIQLVVSPNTENLDIPNEDARAVDLEDSNLFALNRFPGYDRWEDGSRNLRLRMGIDRPKWSIYTVVGQSYRLSREPSIFPNGTGLTDRFSDIVGRTRVRFGRLIDVTSRFRIDKDNLALRRGELDLTVGTDLTYIQAGYLRLNRDISPAIEDLRDKEELRLAGRWQLHRYWSIFGSTVLDLTGKDEDPLSLADGFDPVRHRMGITYEDECLELGVWKRDYERIGEFRKGSTFSINFALKGIGR